jgi:F-type H+-transporting ATPase subunit b
MELFSLAATAGGHAAQLAADSEPLFQVNLFQVIVAALNFVVFLILMWTFAFKPISAMLNQRRERIEQGLKDAEQAKADRANAEQERLATMTDARREANDILARAQKVAQDTRDADIASTREELERLRVRASEEIQAEKARALAELRSEVTDLALAAAGKVVGESMTGERQRRLVAEFLAEAGASGNGSGGTGATGKAG